MAREHIGKDSCSRLCVSTPIEECNEYVNFITNIKYRR